MVRIIIYSVLFCLAFPVATRKIFKFAKRIVAPFFQPRGY